MKPATTNWQSVWQVMSLSRPKLSTELSKKSPKPGKESRDVKQRPWKVELHPEVAKVAVKNGWHNPDFSPTLREIRTSLETNPKQFPTKKGKLKAARAARLRYRGEQWRAIFVLDEMARVARWVGLGKRADVYAKTERRA